ncbi:phosphoribosylformylglycinamidine synthase subunit PurQ [Helicobacter sp. MIT 14-3879]|uniref:phosphoribosylformylglycinamidine synthase subunit PurQ n=1 Tax=Helicobacter sp. MIT 14-3879 TaxID=2040649 RepID=UPI000E1E4ACA|nr:phosphoribosylformylglycinamidine synthase subunit PurQ [Helicobacter sp. MIT 14-3879]RDU60613.1 phosphoribosylformylglycinamidine synthase I [Helicobacter sp. MIT 14-3879]
MVAILIFPGTNCHEDIAYIYEYLGYETCFVWHTEKSLPKETKLAIIAGGFSYGDYLRCGAIAAMSDSIKALKKYADKGGRILGICNGFQILCEANMLPGTLMRNTNLKFIAQNAQLEVVDTDNMMFKNYQKKQRIRIPIAHAEGNYQIDLKTLESLYANKQILLTYVKNINGSIDRIAGICNKEKNVFALMPHPERAINFKSINVDTEDNSSENIAGIEMLKTMYN